MFLVKVSIHKLGCSTGRRLALCPPLKPTTLCWLVVLSYSGRWRVPTHSSRLHDNLHLFSRIFFNTSRFWRMATSVRFKPRARSMPKRACVVLADQATVHTGLATRAAIFLLTIRAIVACTHLGLLPICCVLPYDLQETRNEERTRLHNSSPAQTVRIKPATSTAELSNSAAPPTR